MSSSSSMELQSFKRLKDEPTDEDDEGDLIPSMANISVHPNSSSGSHSTKYAKTGRDSLPRQPSSSASPESAGPEEAMINIRDVGSLDESKDDYRSSNRRTQVSGPPETDSHGNIVIATNIHKTYLLGVEGVPALRGVSLSIKRGEFIMILGSSGGGKTSLLNILGTIDKPTKGELHICGHRITSNTTDEEFATLRLKKIGFVFQTFNLIPSMTAEENVSLPMILEGRLSTSEISQRACELLERVGLSERKDHLPSQLSGGEQQRVTIARAIANRPSVLLLDEPTGDLDTVNGTIILSLLLHLNRQEQITCIMVTHDTALKAYAHRVVHMVDGKVARLETISPQLREEMDTNLAQKVQQIRGEWSGAIPQAAQPKTEYREASDYESFLRPDDD